MNDRYDDCSVCIVSLFVRVSVVMSARQLQVHHLTETGRGLLLDVM